MNLKGLVEFVSLGLISLRSGKEVEHRDIFGREIEHADEFFHPQKFRGIPMFDADSILRHYGPQLKRLKEVIDIGDHRRAPNGRSLFDELYVDVLKRFITFAHMIPASEDHHHSHTGGLLTHSIEASIESLRWSRELKCHMTDMPDLNTQIKPVIDYCAWLGGLCHDIGKIMRDISVDAVEVIHPLTKRPIPMTSPVLSWYPQRESLIQWARANNISAYHVTWLRHRTHNRHNIDSGQILQPLLQGTYAMDYILSSPIRQELYSELVRCLSGFSHQKGHLPDCIRMGDSVSTNKALSIQYDPVRGQRRISTATKLYHCINIARREWEWNIQKARGWVIGREVYLRWSSAIDSIVHASVDNQYGLPTDTRSILTIMESNGFSHLFSQDCTNDRIIKFTPGDFTQKQIHDITTGKTPVSWLDLVKIVTPNVIFGENPVPPSMGGIVLLPNAKQFYLVSKDGEIEHLTPQAPAISQESPAEAATTNPAQVVTTQMAPAAPSAQVSVLPEQKPAKTPASGKPVSSKKQQPAPKPKPVDMLPKAASKKSALNAELFGDDIDEDAIDIEKITASLDEFDDLSELSIPLDSDTLPTLNDQLALESPEPHVAPVAEQIAIDPPPTKGLKTSATLESIIENKVTYYKTKKDVLIDALSAETLLEKPLQEILQSLKAANELKQNLMSPNVLTAFHEKDGVRHKCIPIEPKYHSIFADPALAEPSVNAGNTPQQQALMSGNNANAESSVIEQASTDAPKNSGSKTESVKAKQSTTKDSIKETAKENSGTDKSALEKSNTEPKKKRKSSNKDLSNKVLSEDLSNIEPSLPVPLKNDEDENSSIPAPQDDACEETNTVFDVTSEEVNSAEQMNMPQSVEHASTEDPLPPCISEDYSASLSALADSAPVNSLLHFLLKIEASGLISYAPDGKIEVNFSAVTSEKYKPVGKSKILIALVNAGGIRDGQKILIGLNELLQINIEEQS